MKFSLRRIAIGLGILIAGAFAGSLTGGFHFDDGHSVEANTAIRSLSNIPSFWTDARTSSFIPENRVYRPLVYTVYALAWALGKGSTVPFHVFKIAMHWGFVLAFFLIWRWLFSLPGWWPAAGVRLRFPLFSRELALSSDWAALLLSVTLAIHPTTTECVDYVSATTSLQCALFYVWAYWFYLKARNFGESASSKNARVFSRPRFAVLSLFLFFASVFSKEEGITLPAVVVLTEVWVMGVRGTRLVLARAAPYVALAALMAFWIYAMRPEEGHASRGYNTSWEYFMTQWRAYLWYFRLWFWPWDLNADYATIVFSKSIFEAPALQALLGNGVIVGLAWLLRKTFPAFLFGLTWYFVTISPASSVVVLAEAINEHRQYLAYVGFAGGTWPLFWRGIGSLADLSRRPVAIGALLVAIWAALFAGTQERHRVWQSDESLWTDTVEKNPTSGRALNNLALVYMARGDYDRAIPLLESCQRHWPSYMHCYLNTGVSLQAKGDLARAEEAYLKALQLNSSSVYATFHYGNFLETARGDCSRALPYFFRALELTGYRYAAADIRIAKCKLRLGLASEIAPHLSRAVAVDPNLRNEADAIAAGRAQ